MHKYSLRTMSCYQICANETLYIPVLTKGSYSSFFKNCSEETAEDEQLFYHRKLLKAANEKRLHLPKPAEFAQPGLSV